MNKKELRKELELVLVKTIEEALNKRNHKTAKKIRKTTYEASKTVAKKFYKSLKTESARTSKKGIPAKKVPVKTVKTTAKPAVKAKAKTKK